VNEADWRLLDADRPVDEPRVGGWLLRRGDRVRLRPGPRGDVFDLALSGKTATVESVEQDLEGNFQVSVVVDDDPGAGLGLLRQPGHRFFFSPGELEPLPPHEPAPSTPTRGILIAGIGNVFLGDDGFGVEVAQRLAARPLPAGVAVEDFGIRGYDLAYALLEPRDATLLVDACSRGGPPGTLFVIEPDSADLEPAGGGPLMLDGHAMHPLHVLRLARSLGARLDSARIIGCEPATLGPPEGQMGLSPPVQAAVEKAVTLIEELLARLLATPR
jgi:hydrogenase maturation protease